MPFLPLFEKKTTCCIVSSGIQSMVNDALYFNDALYLYDYVLFNEMLKCFI